MRRDNDKTTDKLNTPYATNSANARRASRANTDNYDYEFGRENNLGETANRRKNRNNARENAQSRYQYEFGNEANVSAKDSPLARGANIANAFSNANAATADEASRNRYNEEYAREHTANTEVSPKRTRDLKRKYQDNLRQNYNVEFSDDDLICDCDNCENCNCKK